MAYQDIRIDGDIDEALSAWLNEKYGPVIDIEVDGMNEDTYAAVAYAAVHCRDRDKIQAVVMILRHVSDAGPYDYRLGEMLEIDGPVLDYCPVRILDQLSPTDDAVATHWRDRCRENAAAPIPFTRTMN
jgi:hypothetical protein